GAGMVVCPRLNEDVEELPPNSRAEREARNGHKGLIVWLQAQNLEEAVEIANQLEGSLADHGRHVANFAGVHIKNLEALAKLLLEQGQVVLCVSSQNPAEQTEDLFVVELRPEKENPDHFNLSEITTIEDGAAEIFAQIESKIAKTFL